ncbi:biliverdin-producing heme oxygenase [Nocardioides sp. zg-579]|uniref:heme oxygenase (biliverdin-producing) n=1 Tax=Nocardioides marmotae TaxID=2663857 RepID=A0A6I3J0H1_9ACTN|nr:biliverdin-producing heme oxygenase [Nocardioides marmotae]MCR6031348.1 biliverdin-producing heme oxygenase [Gordonia jinghuaiqii]MTB94987.1 biliverdin-producing heme oxygenase [Nocardioides marmotae]QKE02507.1 biliverdin-producing heme oxygenase [Nocardioides marmotae]
MTVLDAGPTPALSTAMRDGSRTEHEDAEGSAFVTELLEGRISEAGYAAYLRRLRAVYAALENVVRERAADPLVAAVHDPALERLAVLDADLDHWAPGEPHELAAGESPAAEAYCARLHGATWGGDLVAHHYTRYLGDLSGGQAIGRVLDRTFGLEGAGTAFYAFTEIPKPKPYKDAYRARLDALGLDAAGVARVVDEVKVAFRLNQALFSELGERIDAYRRPAPQD